MYRGSPDGTIQDRDASLEDCGLRIADFITVSPLQLMIRRVASYYRNPPPLTAAHETVQLWHSVCCHFAGQVAPRPFGGPGCTPDCSLKSWSCRSRGIAAEGHKGTFVPLERTSVSAATGRRPSPAVGVVKPSRAAFPAAQREALRRAHTPLLVISALTARRPSVTVAATLYTVQTITYRPGFARQHVTSLLEVCFWRYQTSGNGPLARTVFPLVAPLPRQPARAGPVDRG
jgi:hypothetical protein